jgi:hypothetical protein
MRPHISAEPAPVMRVLPQLRVGAVSDRAEREADAVAERVMRMPSPGAASAQSCAGGCGASCCGSDEIRPRPVDDEELVSPKSVGAGGVPVSRSVEAGIRAQRGSGGPLPSPARRFFEPRFGADLSHVRVHADGAAAQLASRVNARAFTIGRDVFFGAGEWGPGTASGRRLLAHELTHTIQQGNDLRRQEAEPAEPAPAEEEAEQAQPGHPCNGTSLAATVGPSTQGVTVTLAADEFGRTSRLGAHFGFAACSNAGTWRFHLDSLRVPVDSAVKPADFRTEVSGSDESVVTASTHGPIAADLAPNGRVTFGASCRSDAGTTRFRDPVTNYSRRRTYWKRQLVVDHEAFHRTDWMDRYRPKLVAAERQVWAHSIPADSASGASAAVTAARATLTGFMAGAYQAACLDYAPQKESRAYTAGAPDYQALTDAVRARAVTEGWT